MAAPRCRLIEALEALRGRFSVALAVALPLQKPLFSGHFAGAADHRHRRLLRARRERPRGRRAAEQRDEFPSLQLIELHSMPCQPICRIIELAKNSQRVSER